MPRMKRLDLAGVAQHVVQRGNDRQPCFFRTGDYEHYLHNLRESCLRYACRVHAYVLMTNHAHLLMTPEAPGAISRVMQALGRGYVRHVNDTLGRSGTLWEGRYKASLVDSERYLMACYRYIELNPVRAAMVSEAGDYIWSQQNRGQSTFPSTFPENRGQSTFSFSAVANLPKAGVKVPFQIKVL